MYLGKTLFAQLIDFLPWTTFNRIVTRYCGDLMRVLGDRQAPENAAAQPVKKTTSAKKSE